MIARFVGTTSDAERRLSLIQRLRNAPASLDEALERPILRGVAYHHAGLTTEERELIEEAYDTGVLNVLTATATLAAGINLPSRRVIFRGPRMARDILSVASYRQMKGRAGRKGKDTEGESFLCYTKPDEENVKRMVNGEMPSISSRLGVENGGFERALLEAVVANLATSQTAIETYATFTLYFRQAEDKGDVLDILQKAADYLIEQKLVEPIDSGFTQAGGALQATMLGKAIVTSALSIDEGLFVHRELARSMRCFILDDELHLIYHCTPVYAQCEVDWKLLRTKLDKLPDESILVANTLGVSPALVNRVAQGAVLKPTNPADAEKLRIHKRFWIALMLQQLIKEEPLAEVADNFGIERGFLQNLSATTTGFAGMVQSFCAKLGWGNLALLLGGFKKRLVFGVRTDLLEMAKLPYVKGFTARVFWDGGMRSISAIAESDVEDIVPLLVKARTTWRRKKLDDADAELQDRIDRRSARIIIRAAARLRDQAKDFDFDE